MQPVTPRGFRDVLFDEAREREAVTSAIAAAFSAWGYEPVETPVAEEYRTLEAGSGGDLEQTAFRFFDLDGSLLALRPEMTVPIARVVASRLAGSPGPHRIRYCAPVFREHASLRGQAREFTQVGVELVGARGAAADTEVVLLLIDALEASGLKEFTVGIGTAEVLRALLARAGGTAEWQAAAIFAAQSRNLVELDRLASREDLAPELSRALREVPRLRGAREALERCVELAGTCGCAGALDNLSETWTTLEALGRAGRMQLDFGIMRSFAYYTGLQIEAYSPGLGLPLAGGGRYDEVLSTFDRPAPAAGFALGLERLMIALAEQDASPALEPLDAVLGGEGPADVFRAAARLRAAGWRVRIACDVTGAALVREADAGSAAEALEASGDVIARIDRAGEPAGALGDPLPSPPRLSWAARGGEGS
ncbi:MAG: ATP phosphoribosyltransferase regulatory subunit [Actinobacteria bacterium]|nr:ATP phosphoribosyltransferase regulatory subunit [Actinomycetota bacterium]